jgi:hypothetical protein
MSYKQPNGESPQQAPAGKLSFEMNDDVPLTSPPSYVAGDNARLMEEFTIDPNTAKSTEPLSIPLLYTAAYGRTYRFITAARTIVLLLNLGCVVGLLFSSWDPFDSSLAPITTFSTFFLFVPTMFPLLFHVSMKTALTAKSTEVREQRGSTRNAVLVEDPITGEERWMLEPKDKKKPQAEFGRIAFLVFDLIAAGILILSIALCIKYGATKDVVSLVWVLTLRFITL